LDPLSNLDRVASRLNRLALQRALYRTVGLALLSAAALGAASFWLEPRSFRLLFSGLVLLCVGVGFFSFVRLRTAWARRIEAARWVEREADLDERLLTLVSAAESGRELRLWPELEQDNRTQLPRWENESLGIRRVPANVSLLAAGLIAAIAALLPFGEAPAPLPFGSPAVEGLLGQVEGEGPQRSGAIPQPGSGEAEGELSGEGGKGVGEGTGADGALARVQTELREQFQRSLVARTLGGGSEGEPGEPPSGIRGDLPESDRTEQPTQDGGVTPPEGMGLLVEGQDEGEKEETVRRLNPEGGEDTTASQKGGMREGEAPKSGEGKGAPSDGKGKEGEQDPNAELLVSEDATPKVGGAGGSGPGDAKATAPLLAKAPLDLSKGRGRARFSLTLGGASGSEGGEGGTAMAEPQSYIASGERGAQAEDRRIRHESVPPEYEGVIKRVFERKS